MARLLGTHLNLVFGQEYVGTCSEYSGYMSKPGFSPSMLGCSQEDWHTTYRKWGVIQLFYGIISNALILLLLVSGGKVPAGAALISFVLNMAFAYLAAHLGWFAVVKKHGCCCLCCICFECNCLLVFWAVLMLFAAGFVLLSQLAAGSILGFIINIPYAIILSYMGFACFQIFQQPAGARQPPVVGQPTAAAVQPAVELHPSAPMQSNQA